MTTCTVCRRTWTSRTQCHCAGCHEHFTNVRAFDIHQTNDGCRPPGSVLTSRANTPRLTQRPDGIWARSGDGSPFAANRGPSDGKVAR